MKGYQHARVCWKSFSRPSCDTEKNDIYTECRVSASARTARFCHSATSMTSNTGQRFADNARQLTVISRAIRHAFKENDQRLAYLDSIAQSEWTMMYQVCLIQTTSRVCVTNDTDSEMQEHTRYVTECEDAARKLASMISY